MTFSEKEFKSFMKRSGRVIYNWEKSGLAPRRTPMPEVQMVPVPELPVNESDTVFDRMDVLLGEVEISLRQAEQVLAAKD